MATGIAEHEFIVKTITLNSPALTTKSTSGAYYGSFNCDSISGYTPVYVGTSYWAGVKYLIDVQLSNGNTKIDIISWGSQTTGTIKINVLYQKT